ncbi:MAG: 5-formyltetrahydrofolate cyclo-ligase [Chloroflexota bacterium]|nr:MAG: 5-formyltetrahydrofolate cyclo-ligase [Chloroflexota bacterium]
MTTLQTEWSGRHIGKDQLRSEVWSRLMEQGVAIGQPFGHIPKFKGADQAAERLASLPIWQHARVIKSNPDSPQQPVRGRALLDGKKLYMAVPRLAQERCFVELTKADLEQQGISLKTAATIKGAMRYGRLVFFSEMEPIDLVVTGCVAVSRDGGRTGKGAGFADLELGILRQMGLIRADTPIVTTVHSLQLVESAQLPMQVHDWSLTWIVTPDEVIETHSTRSQPLGLDWTRIQPEQVETIPVLRKLKAQVSHEG